MGAIGVDAASHLRRDRVSLHAGVDAGFESGESGAKIGEYREGSKTLVGYDQRALAPDFL
jgi:hypothetical protein